MARHRVPRARAIAGLDGQSPLKARWRRFRTVAKPVVHDTLELAIGLWPIWLLTGAAAGLVWLLAMSQSP